MYKSITLLGLSLTLSSLTTSASQILIDYKDQIVDGVHDVEILKGGFTDLTSATPSPWQEVQTDSQYLNNFNSPGSGGTNGVVSSSFMSAVDTGYIIQADDVFNVSFAWRDASGWLSAGQTKVSLFYTVDDLIDAPGTGGVVSLLSGSRVSVSEWETESGSLNFNDNAIGKKLFVGYGANNVGNNQYARMDDIFVEVISVPEPSSTALLGLGALGLVMRRRR